MPIDRALSEETTEDSALKLRQLTRNPLAHAPTASVKRGTAHLCIADPLGRSIGLKQGWMPDLLASHPPMANRITALRQMGFQE